MTALPNATVRERQTDRECRLVGGNGLAAFERRLPAAHRLKTQPSRQGY